MIINIKTWKELFTIAEHIEYTSSCHNFNDIKHRDDKNEQTKFIGT